MEEERKEECEIGSIHFSSQREREKDRDRNLDRTLTVSSSFLFLSSEILQSSFPRAYQEERKDSDQRVFLKRHLKKMRTERRGRSRRRCR